MSEHRLWGLGALSLIFEWFESLLTILSGPLLTAGLMIALTDLLTDGRLLTTQPELLYAWAIAMGAGLDAQLIGSSVKVGRAARTGHPWQAVLYGVLVVALSYVAFIAAQVFATQQAYGITMSEALGRLGMDGTTWLVQRSILSVVLVVLSGLLRYTAPGQATIIEERAKLERELTLEPLRAQVRMRKALGWRDVAATAFAKGPQIITKPIPPTGPGTPAAAPGASKPRTSHEDWAGDEGALHVVGRARRRRSRTANAERKVRTLLAREPRLSASELARRLGISNSTASKYRRLLESESQQREEVAQ